MVQEKNKRILGKHRWSVEKVDGVWRRYKFINRDLENNITSHKHWEIEHYY